MEPEQWRRNYYDTLQKLETEEKRWKALDDVLRRLVGRLCIAARGVDAQLDDALKQIGQAARQPARAEELEPLLTRLSSAIAALDGKGPATPAPAQAPAAAVAVTPPVVAPMSPAAAAPQLRIDALLKNLLDRLSLLPDLQPQVDKLHEFIAAAKTDAQLADACTRIADLVNVQRAQLEREKAHVAAILQQVTQKLDEIAGYLVREAADQETARGSSEELNRRVLGEVRSLDNTLTQASDLTTLQQQVRSRLDSINVHLLDFRTREEARVSAYKERAETMRQRIAELEKETDTLQRSLQQKARQVLTDSLTGLPNRLAYDERIAQAIRRWKRNGEGLCVGAWDIDRFKRINDGYGHQAGDKVLQIIGQHLARSVRETDCVARYGGEEFVMILEGASLDEAVKLSERLRESVSKIGFHFRGDPVTVTICCGLTAFVEGDTAEQVFERADRLLYQAKNEGRDRCVSG